MNVTIYDIALRFVGMTEVPGVSSNPQILAMLRLDNPHVEDEATAWCAAFVSFCAWLLRLPRSTSLAARSWLKLGTSVPLEQAKRGDVVILKRGSGAQPGPDVIAAPGHVGFFSGREGNMILVLGGNQGNSVSVDRFPVASLLGIRRIEPMT